MVRKPFVNEQYHKWSFKNDIIYIFYYIIIAAQICDTHKDNAYMRLADDGFSTRYKWMGDVRNDTQLSEMAIPGTHNSAGYKKLQTPGEIVRGFYTSITGIWKKNKHLDTLDELQNIITIDMQATQVLNIRQQLQYGIRVFDVNLIYAKNQFGLIHKEQETFLNVMFDQFLNQLKSFLTDNPTETVLFTLAVKEEVGENDKAPTTRMHQYLTDPEISKFYLKTKNVSVTLGEARGKFIIISKDVNFNEFGLNGNGDNFVIMNENYLSTNWDLYWKKWMPVKEQLKKAREGNKNTFYINFLTGYGGSFPYFVASGHSSPWTSAPRLATGLTTPGFRRSYPDFPRVSCFIRICTIAFEGINILARDHIQAYNKDIKNQNRGLGIIMADFPGDSLIGTIINNNALFLKTELV